MNFDTLLNCVVFFTYGAICIISIIFTFSLDTYSKINEKLNWEMFSSRTVIDFLEKNIDWLDNWFMSNNKKVGPILIFLSLVDLKLWLDIIKNFKF